MKSDFDEFLEKLRQLLENKSADDGDFVGSDFVGSDLAGSDSCIDSGAKDSNPKTADKGRGLANNRSDAKLFDTLPGMDQIIPVDPATCMDNAAINGADTGHSDTETTRTWSTSEDWILRLTWGTVQAKFISTMLNMSVGEVRHRATQLRAQQSERWTKTDLQLLRRLYGSRKNEDLEVTLMKSSAQIAVAAKRMNLTKDQSKISNQKVALDLNKNRKKARSTKGRSKTKSSRASMPRWTQAAIEHLRLCYSDHDNQEIANMLGRSVTSIANKAWQLGLSKSNEQLSKIARLNVARRHNRS